MKIAIMGKIHPDGLEIFNKNNIENYEIDSFDDQDLAIKLSDVDGIVIRTASLNSKILSKCKNLKIVSRHGVGYDNVDSNYLSNNHIALAITGTSNSVSVANRCLGFDMNVYVHDPFVSEKLIVSKGCININKEEGLKIADYISIHVPLNDKTKNFISFKEFDLTKNNLILVNTARGGIINEEALLDALKKNKINSAGLDVFENEPPIENHPFFKEDNILLSPHNAALTLECRKRMSVEACENVLNFLTNDSNLNKDNIINLKFLI